MLGLNEKYSRYVNIAIAALVIILLAAVMLMHNLTKLKIPENESSAIASLEAIDTAMKSWIASQPLENRFNVTMPILAAKYPERIDKKLATSVKDGYNFIICALSPSEYFCLALPVSKNGTGTNIFRVTESGIVETEVPGPKWQAVK